jgi:hypothetical protein
MAFYNKTTNNTLFTKNTNDFYSYFRHYPQEYLQSITLNQILTDMIDEFEFVEIQNLSINYARGEFDTIKQVLTQQTYNEYSERLYQMQKPSNVYYEKIRTFYKTVLEGLLQSVNLHNEITDATASLNIYKTKADMLNSIDALIQQLNMLRRNVSLFPDQSITVIAAQIKPEYLAYIHAYGYPENGIWDPDLLGSIIASIGPVTNP